MATSQDARRALRRVQRAAARLAELQSDATDDLRDAAAHHDPRLNPDGLGARRTELQQQVREQTARRLAQLQQRIDRESKVVRDYAERVRPRIRPDDVAGHLRLQQSWERVKLRLEAGQDLTRVLRSSDADTALAIRVFGPDWLSAQHGTEGDGLADALAGQTADELDLTAFLNTVDARLGQLHGGHVATAVELSQELAGVLAGWSPAAAQVDLFAQGTAGAEPTTLESAIASRIETDYARAQWPTTAPGVTRDASGSEHAGDRGDQAAS